MKLFWGKLFKICVSCIHIDSCIYVLDTKLRIRNTFQYTYLLYICIHLYNTQSIYLSQYMSYNRLSHNQSSHIQISQQIIALAGNHIGKIFHITQQVHCTQFLNQFFIHVAVRLYLLVCSANTKILSLNSLLVTLFECTLVSECIRTYHNSLQ